MSLQPESDPTAPPRPEHLAPTRFIDSEHEELRAFAQEATAGAHTDAERVSLLFAAVRDAIRYDPYTCSADPADYVASAVLLRGEGYCIPKAVLLAACARAVGVPARLGFSDVRNHLQSERLQERMGTDLFIFHGWTDLHVDGAWRKATPAFNAALCERFGVAPLEFDGTTDALLHPFAGDGSRHMEYVAERGVWDDLPLATILAALAETYPGLAGDDLATMQDPAFRAA